MKAGEKTLVKYLEGNDQRFVIPVFQRRYDWRKVLLLAHNGRLLTELPVRRVSDIMSTF